MAATLGFAWLAALAEAPLAAGPGFPTAGLVTVFLATGFFTTVFFATGFFTTGFFATGFFATGRPAAAFFGDDLAAALRGAGLGLATGLRDADLATATFLAGALAAVFAARAVAGFALRAAASRDRAGAFPLVDLAEVELRVVFAIFLHRFCRGGRVL